MTGRSQLLRRAWLLALITIIWNILEGIIAVTAGAVASSVALIGFGIDSYVETASAAVVAYRVRKELSGSTRRDTERLERSASRITGALLLCLAAYIVIDAGRRLLGFGAEARVSVVGIILTSVSLVLMPLLVWGKLRTARELNSASLRNDAFESITCLWLSFTTLSGLALNALLGWSWADPIAALVLVPLIVREGLGGMRGEED